jgi:hypothetical protein
MKKGDLEFYNKAVDQTRGNEATFLLKLTLVLGGLFLSLMFIGGIWLSVIEIIK